MHDKTNNDIDIILETGVMNGLRNIAEKTLMGKKRSKYIKNMQSGNIDEWVLNRIKQWTT